RGSELEEGKARSRTRARISGQLSLQEEVAVKGGRRPSVRGRPRRDPPVLDEKAEKLAAFELLAHHAWSTRELIRRLRRRGAPADVAGTVVAELQSRGYLDDEAFARWWAQARAEGRRIGSIRLRQELTTKGIP